MEREEEGQRTVKTGFGVGQGSTRAVAQMEQRTEGMTKYYLKFETPSMRWVTFLHLFHQEEGSTILPTGIRCTYLAQGTPWSRMVQDGPAAHPAYNIPKLTAQKMPFLFCNVVVKVTCLFPEPLLSNGFVYLFRGCCLTSCRRAEILCVAVLQKPQFCC